MGLLSIAALLGCVAGCSYPTAEGLQRRLDDQWSGRNEEDLIRGFGVPDREYVLPSGNKILVYDKARLIRATSYGCQIEFEIDHKTEFVRDIRFHGDSCVSR